jgi:hypothetical protein
MQSPVIRRGRFSRSPLHADSGYEDRERRPDISAVIVNFNAGDYLTNAVDSLLSARLVPDQVIVVDNASSDDSVARLRSAIDDDRLTIVAAPRNLGFAGACNLGIQSARGEAILFLNPDCRVYPDALERLVRELDADPTIGMVGPLIVNPDGSEQRGCRRDVPNPWQIFCVSFGLHRLMPRHPRFRTFNRETDPLPDKPTAVPAISGACMLVAHETIERIGYLDDSYFLHFEDLDWCMRLGAIDGRIVFVPGAVVEHTQGVCSRSRPIRVEYHKHRSLIRFLRQNFAGFYPTSFMAAVSVVVMLRLAPTVLRILLHQPGNPAGGWSHIFAEPRRSGGGSATPNRAVAAGAARPHRR